ncbi:MAG TPA: hypothetical protein VMG82_12905 [Candidatus Sulfotelmatobacter sp.]|nr:hypothetical protein [Candidatus Sulfotelmatobacter sp.]
MISRAKSAWIAAALVFSTNAWAQDANPRIVHVFVALADNQHQGIVPVAPILGNGDDPEHNLYWGSAYGVKAFFSHSSQWKRWGCFPKPNTSILERCIFIYNKADVYLIADAYRGIEIKQAILDFLDSAAGGGAESIPGAASDTGPVRKLPIRGGAALLAYVGHDGLMDFQLPQFPRQRDGTHRDAIVLACASKQFFAEAIRTGGAYPVVWTTGLMAPEAYTLQAALDGWIAGETREQIRDRAAGAYDKYQKCGAKAARRLLVTGW